MNYYEILGVTPDSTKAEIKSAYRKLARKYHPDVNPEGVKRFKDISNAYETLIDDKKKLEYDTLNGFFKTYQKAPKNDQNAQKKQKNDEFSSNFAKKRAKKNEKFFSDIFSSLFEGEKYQKKSPEPENGSDINSDITILLREAIKGAQRVVNVVHSGPCPRCGGRKFINGSKCPVCSGSGEYSIHKRINVKIPANVKNGSKLRLKGEGGEGRFGGKNGDLYLFIRIKGNSKISYVGLDILYTVPVSPYEAVLGGEIVVPYMDVRFKLPPKTSSGQKFRLAGQGLKKNGKSGDMIITVSIEIPKTLSDDEVKLYEKLKKLSADNIRENIFNDE